jgi:hypothetical protein
MSHQNPYEPFLGGDYATQPAMARSDGSDGPGLKMHTSFMRPRLLNKRCALQAGPRRSARHERALQAPTPRKQSSRGLQLQR